VAGDEVPAALGRALPSTVAQQLGEHDRVVGVRLGARASWDRLSRLEDDREPGHVTASDP